MGLYLKEEEHGCAVHCDAANYGPLQEDGAEAGGLGCLEMVETDGDRLRGCDDAGGRRSG